VANANPNPGTVSVIATANNTVVATIPVGSGPAGVAVTPDGSKVYVTTFGGSGGAVSVIDTASNTVIAIPLGSTEPFGVAVTPDGSKVYVALDTVSVIATASNTVIGSPISVGSDPIAFGKFIQQSPTFAGTPGQSTCHGASVSALAQKYGGMSAAAAAFGLKVQGLQDAIGKFCGK
jgi:YVTN family beta-propeller protein